MLIATLSNPNKSLAAGLLAAMLLFFTLPATTLAAEEMKDAEAAEEPLWATALGLSFLSTTGNSDTETFGIDLTAERQPTPWGLAIKVQFDRAEEDSRVTAERAYAGLRGTRTLTERWDAFVGASVEQDELAGLDLRTLIEAGGIYHALLGPTHLLDLDIGLTWTDEDRLEPNPDVDSIGALAGFTYTWTISETATFGQRVLFFPNFDESDDWRLTSDTTLTAAISDRFALQFGYSLRHRNLPIGDNDDTDTTTKVSLVWTR